MNYARTKGAWMTGTDSVCAWYNEMCPEDMPYFSVWSKSPKVLKFSYDGESRADGEAMLRSNLEPAQANGLHDVLVIRLHKNIDARQGINDRSPYWASTDFNLCAPDDYESEIGYMGSGSLAALHARVKALETGGVGEESRGIMGSLQGLIESEPVQQVIAGIIAGIAGKIIPGGVGAIPGYTSMRPAAHQMAINGIKDEGVSTETYQALLILESVDPRIEDDLQLLARLSKDNIGLFNTMVKSLRGIYGKT